MEDRALQDALETECGLGLAAVLGREQGRGFVEELVQFLFQLVNVGAAGAQHLDCRGIAEQGVKQVLDSHELMLLFTRLLESEVQGKFKFLAQHNQATVVSRLPQVCTATDAGVAASIR